MLLFFMLLIVYFGHLKNGKGSRFFIPKIPLFLYILPFKGNAYFSLILQGKIFILGLFDVSKVVKLFLEPLYFIFF